jgi:hypothetical protein
MTEAELAARLARDLGPLAADASWSAAAALGQAQGHYTDPIADAKDDAGVTDDLSDVTEMDALRLIRRLALLACLERLELHYATLVDTSTGGDSGSQIVQKLSQVRQAIGVVRVALTKAIATSEAAAVVAAAAPTKASGVNLRGHRRPDYDVGGGNVVEDEE